MRTHQWISDRGARAVDEVSQMATEDARRLLGECLLLAAQRGSAHCGACSATIADAACQGAALRPHGAGGGRRSPVIASPLVSTRAWQHLWGGPREHQQTPGLMAASRHRAGRRTPHHGRRPGCPRRIGTAGRPSQAPNQLKAASHKIVHMKCEGAGEDDRAI
jgi:hypothetical protein